MPAVTVTPVAGFPSVNRLLDGLPRTDYERILSCGEQVSLIIGDTLCEQDHPIHHVYFPCTGFISLVAALNGHQPMEVGLIGSEGMLGVTLILGVNTAPLRAVVQGAGIAVRLTTAMLQHELRETPALFKILSRYLYVVTAQTSQSLVCSHFHETELRLARWLLMTHDRAHADHFYLTHQRLADMLGVQRSAITIAAGALQKQNLISYTRGEIRILDREGLKAESCECYEELTDDYERLLT